MKGFQNFWKPFLNITQMKNIALLLSCFLFLQFITAQPITFSTHIDVNNNSDWGYKIIQLADSSFVIFSASACYSAENTAGFVGCIVVVKTNKYGQILWKKEYKHPSHTFFSIGITETVNGNFFIGGEGTYPNDNFQKFVLKINSEGDSLWLKHYGTPSKEDLISDATSTPDGYLLLLGEIGTFNVLDSWDLCLSKIDQEGNLIWQKKYGGEGFEAGNHVSIDYDGGYFISGRSSSFNPGGRNRGYVVKTDRDGNELWSKSYDFCDEQLTGAQMYALQHEAGYLMSCGLDSTYAADTAIYMSSGMMYVRRMDLAGNRIWDYPFEALNYITRAGRPIPMKDGSVWVIGINNTPLEEGDDFSTTGWIAKLSPDGELLWERQYLPKNKGLIQRLTDLVETFDGGVALTGKYEYRANGTRYNDIWLLKLDQDGCIEAGCDEPYLILEDTVVGIEEVESGEVFFEVYPNPNNGQANFQIQKELLLNGKVQIQILDINGRLLQAYDCHKDNKELSINTESLENGLYLCILLNNGKPISHIKMSIVK